MDAIGKLSDDMRRHFRMKLRNLFIKFIRKFGSVHLNGVELGYRTVSLFTGHKEGLLVPEQLLPPLSLTQV